MKLFTRIAILSGLLSIQAVGAAAQTHQSAPLPRLGNTGASMPLAATAAAPANSTMKNTGMQSRVDLPVNRLPVQVHMLRAGGPPPNDNCAAAQTLTVQAAGGCTSPTAGDNSQATQSITGPSCDLTTTGIFADVWYSFNSGTNSSITMNFDPGTMLDWVYVLYSACGGTELACLIGPGPTTSLTVAPSTTYKLRIYSNTQFGAGGQFTICLEAPGAAPVNNECSGAVLLTMGSSCVATTGNVSGATQSLAAITCATFTGTANDDVWYRFVATATTATIEVQGSTSFDAVVDLRSGACTGTNIGCADATVNAGLESISAGGLTIGATYYVRVYDYATGVPLTTTFTICVYNSGAPPVNDDCSGAVVQLLGVPGSVTVNGNNTGATDTEGLGIASAWEAFTIGACADVTVDYCGTSPAFGNAFLNLFIGCPWATFFANTSFDITTCPDGNVSIFYQDVPAGTYYYPVLTEPGSMGPYSITFTAVACGGIVPPANDECASAVLLTVGSSCSPTSGDVAGATQSLAAITCTTFTGTADDDVWYKFVANATTATIDVQGSASFDAVVDLRSGACTGTNIGCADATVNAGLESIPAGGLTIGATYYVRVYDYAAGVPLTTTFTICVYNLAGGSFNDLCSDATPVLLTPGSTLVFNGDNTGCTNTEGLTYPNSWEAFTTTQCMDVSWDFCGSLDGMLIYTGAYEGCPATQIARGCNNPYILCPDGVTNSYQTNITSLPAGTYYIQIPYVAGLYGGQYQINLSGTACTTVAPANDNCPGAVPLTSGLLSCNSVIGTVVGATQSLPDLACAGFLGAADDDVWYSFTAMASGGTIVVAAFDSLDAVIQLYTGTCAGLAPLNCADAGLTGDTETLTYSGLTVGNTYYFRVHSFYIGQYCGGFFNVCVTYDPSTGVGQTASTQWSVYPNPTDGAITITNAHLEGDALIEIVDATGRVAASHRLRLSSGMSYTLPMERTLAAGSYQVRISTAQGTTSQALMVR